MEEWRGKYVVCPTHELQITPMFVTNVPRIVSLVKHKIYVLLFSQRLSSTLYHHFAYETDKAPCLTFWSSTSNYLWERVVTSRFSSRQPTTICCLEGRLKTFFTYVEIMWQNGKAVKTMVFDSLWQAFSGLKWEKPELKSSALEFLRKS